MVTSICSQKMSSVRVTWFNPLKKCTYLYVLEQTRHCMSVSKFRDRKHYNQGHNKTGALMYSWSTAIQICKIKLQYNYNHRELKWNMNKALNLTKGWISNLFLPITINWLIRRLRYDYDYVHLFNVWVKIGMPVRELLHYAGTVSI